MSAPILTSIDCCVEFLNQARFPHKVNEFICYLINISIDHRRSVTNFRQEHAFDCWSTTAIHFRQRLFIYRKRFHRLAHLAYGYIARWALGGLDTQHGR